LIAHDIEQYVRIAVDLASNAEELSLLRHSIRPAMESSPLLDHKGFTERLGLSYRKNVVESAATVNCFYRLTALK